MVWEGEGGVVVVEVVAEVGVVGLDWQQPIVLLLYTSSSVDKRHRWGATGVPCSLKEFFLVVVRRGEWSGAEREQTARRRRAGSVAWIFF